MKKMILGVLVMISCFAANAQNLGEKYEWLKLSYKKIPLRASQPYYDTTVHFGDKLAGNTLENNARYYFQSVTSTDSLAFENNTFTGKGSYTLYTDNKKDEEHTYVVNYTMEVTLKNGKYEVGMHDFEIYYLTNKVEFPAKYKRAAEDDGKSNYFMALFNDRNRLEIKKLAKTMAFGHLPDGATASK